VPSAAVLSAVELDAQLPPPGKAVGQGDEATFVTADLDVCPQPSGVADTWMVVCVGQLRQARGAAGAAGGECGVGDADPAPGPGKVAQARPAASDSPKPSGPCAYTACSVMAVATTA